MDQGLKYIPVVMQLEYQFCQGSWGTSFFWFPTAKGSFTCMAEVLGPPCFLKKFFIQITIEPKILALQCWCEHPLSHFVPFENICAKCHRRDRCILCVAYFTAKKDFTLFNAPYCLNSCSKIGFRLYMCSITRIFSFFLLCIFKSCASDLNPKLLKRCYN